jgi:hypothetical protein
MGQICGGMREVVPVNRNQRKRYIYNKTHRRDFIPQVVKVDLQLWVRLWEGLHARLQERVQSIDVLPAGQEDQYAALFFQRVDLNRVTECVRQCE